MQATLRNWLRSHLAPPGFAAPAGERALRLLFSAARSLSTPEEASAGLTQDTAPSPPAPPPPPDAAPPAPAAPPPPPGTWTTPRIIVAESLWGDGFLFPGGAAETLRLVLPLALTNASTLLLVGAGHGGPAHEIATETGGWVSGYEADPVLAAIATDRATRLNLAKRAPVEVWNPAKPGLKSKYFKHAMALEPLRGAPPELVLGLFAQAMQAGGQLVLIELVADQPMDPADPDVRAIARLHPLPDPLPSETAVTQALVRTGFDVRVVEDLSMHHTALVIAGWREALRRLADAGARPPPATARLLVNEAELWLRRVRLMGTGRLRLMRWHAIRTMGK